MTMPARPPHSAGGAGAASQVRPAATDAAAAGATTERPVVTVSSGVVRGARAGGIDRFLGIPYAAPPFGERRFRAPQSASAWEGERDASAFGPTAPQTPYGPITAKYLPTVEIAG